jgi:hypothetical protein
VPFMLLVTWTTHSKVLAIFRRSFDVYQLAMAEPPGFSEQVKVVNL